MSLKSRKAVNRAMREKTAPRRRDPIEHLAHMQALSEALFGKGQGPYARRTPRKDRP